MQNAYFANGTVGKNFLEKFGILPGKIFNQFMTVDVEDFYKRREIIQLKLRKEIRKQYDIADNTTVIIYVGRLIQNKGVQDLIDALKTLKNNENKILAFIVGEGDFKEELKNRSEVIKQDIIFTGHIDPEQIYKYYYASDILVLPTHNDPWGLVVNEAMACSLPVIVTDAAGSSLDLINENGYVIQSGKIKDLSISIEKLMDKKRKEIFGKNSRTIISHWTYKESYNSLKQLIISIGSKFNEDF